MVKIKQYDNLFWSTFFYQAGTPLAYVYLSDGRTIKIRGRWLERDGESGRIDFLSGRSDAYEELMKIFQRKRA